MTRKHRHGHDCDTKKKSGFDVDIDHRHGKDIDIDIDFRHGFDVDIDIDLRRGLEIDIDIDFGRGYDIDFELDMGRSGHKGCKAPAIVADNDPLVTSIGGEGNAVGEHTLVDADIFSRTMDLGSITVAFGTATFKSTAVADDQIAFASADTFAEVSGADIVVIHTEGNSTEFCKKGVTYTTASSTTSFIAIDFDSFDFAFGPIVINAVDLDFGPDGGFCGYRNLIPKIDGNVATLDVDALATAENTFVEVLSSVLTVEDQISSISAVVVTGVA